MADIEKVKQGLKCHNERYCVEIYGMSCPYWGLESCTHELMGDAMSVIEKLQAENERLKDELAMHEADADPLG